MIATWEVPFWLETPEGTLPLNQPDSAGRTWQLVPASCKATLPVRATDTDLSQADGKTPHRRWRSGYSVHLALTPLGADGDCVAGSDLVEMMDELGLHLNALIRTGLIPGLPNGRLVFTPPDNSNRMFDRCQLFTAPDITVGDAAPLGGALVEFDLDTPLPYYMIESQDSQAMTDMDTDTLTNIGNTDTYPVLRVYGPFEYFQIINHTVVDQDNNPAELIYDSSLPGGHAVGAGHYVEINFFRETAYLDGDQANRKASLDYRYTDFFPLVPGDNSIEVEFSGSLGTLTEVLVLWNSAFA